LASPEREIFEKSEKKSEKKAKNYRFWERYLEKTEKNADSGCRGAEVLEQPRFLPPF
jgi:hypothetical protein